MKTRNCKDCPFAQAIEGIKDKVKCTLHVDKKWYNEKELDHKCDFSEETVKLLSGQKPSQHRLFVLVNDKFKGNMTETLKWAGRAIVQYYRDIMELYADYAFSSTDDEFQDYFGEAWAGPAEFVYLWYPEEDFKGWSRCHWNFRNNGLKYITASNTEDENNQIMSVAIWEDDIYDKNNYDYCDYDWGIECALKILEKELKRIN